MISRRLTSSIFVATFLALGGCHPVAGPDKTVAGALLGAGWGVGAGAIIGNQVDHSGAGMAIGGGFGAVSGMLTGIGLDLEEQTELEQQRELDALKVQVNSNQRTLAMLQAHLDDRDLGLSHTQLSSQVFFDENRASLRSGSIAQLERTADYIKSNPYIGRVELHGHADNLATVEANKSLSEARARSVATFLANRGVSLDRIELVPHGAEQPLATNESEAGRQLNRRVEIVLRK